MSTHPHIGETRTVPRISQPPLDEPLAEAIAVLGLAPLRVALLVYLADHNEVTMGELISATGATRTTIQGHLRPLMDAGVVLTDPPGKIHRKHVRYRLETRLLRRHIENVAIATAPIPGAPRRYRM